MTIHSVIISMALALVAPFLIHSPAAASIPLPKQMAAIGDSITRATNVCCWYGNRPAHSWSTGGDGSDPVSSHYERILALQPAIAGRNFNDAEPGAKMADAADQASQAVAQRAKYVTILLGANDVCTSSASTMTPVATYRAQFRAAMEILHTGLPTARIFVSSIPNVYRLWQILHDNLTAQAVWYGAQICQSMLSPFNNAEDRQSVLTREQALNDVLAQVCAQYSRCRFDAYTVFNFAFQPNHVSTLDYFHPNLAGQATLASLTWSRSWWSS
jgi:lysophospholipase L1-like esterase